MKNKLENLVIETTKKLEFDNIFDRFNKYANSISANIENNAYDIFKKKNGYGLHVYMNLNNAKKPKPEISLRYHGQEVANVNLKLELTPKTKNNQNFFKDIPQFNDSFLWNSKEGTNFRKYFRDCEISNLRSEEHKHESQILRELETRKSLLKSLLFIQPIKIDNKFRIQFPTALNAYGDITGGNIDILARVGSGKNTNILVIELKQSSTYLKRNNGIEQAIRYALFVRELIRNPNSSNKDKWIKIFGFKDTRLKSRMTFFATLMVPLELKKQALEILDPYLALPEYVFENNDRLKVCYIFYTQINDEIKITETHGIQGVKTNSNLKLI
jgi:hypothetical protein